jgi:hypothetical protein
LAVSVDPTEGHYKKIITSLRARYLQENQRTNRSCRSKLIKILNVRAEVDPAFHFSNVKGMDKGAIPKKEMLVRLSPFPIIQKGQSTAKQKSIPVATSVLHLSYFRISFLKNNIKLQKVLPIKDLIRLTTWSNQNNPLL